MRNNKLFLLLILCFTLLTGCGPIYQTSYTYQPPRSQNGKMCVAQCFQTKSYCQQMCQMQDQNCRMQAHQNAYYQFQSYSEEQRSQGKKIDRSIDDFDHSYSECGQKCHCTSDFNLCYQNCGGSVFEHKVCTAFCN